MSKLSNRVQVLLDDEDRRQFAGLAQREGLSLSAWLRRAGQERHALMDERLRFESRADLDSFFDACGRREEGVEPDWEDHRKVIEGSVRGGQPST